MTVAAISTAPNGGVPVGKIRRADDAKLRAAGLLLQTPDGLALFLRRSDVGDHAGEWCIPGGKLEADEQPLEAATREAREEIGWIRPDDVDEPELLDERTSDEDVEFTTYAVGVNNPFVPELDDEHDGWAWAPVDSPPLPLHPGVEATIRERLASDAAESGASRALLRSTIKYPPDSAGKTGVRAINVAMAEGGVEGSLKYAPKAQEFENSGGRITHAGDEAEDAPSLSKRDARYSDGPVSSEPCEACSMFRPGQSQDVNHCSLVQGVIRARGHCSKWRSGTGDEARPLVAADSIALDEKSAREFDLDGRMRVAQVNISKANVCPYLGSEIPGYEELGLRADKIYKLLRDPDELEKAAPTFNGIQLLMRHVPVSADDPKQWDVVGSVGTEAAFERPYLKNSLTVWTQPAIDAIESDEQKELSSAYHYRPDMTPGVYEGEDFDGVMRDIVGNHLALVREGRVGADVVVGDSKEMLNMSARKDGLSRRAGIALLATAAWIRPRLAQDAVLDLRPAFRGVTAKNFADQKGSIVARLGDLTKGKLAKDATIGEVAELLDMIESHGTEGDEDDMPEPMADAAENIGEKFAERDAMDAEPLAAVEEFLRGKLSDEDLERACAMLRGGGEDEDPKLRELGAADDAENEEERSSNARTDRETNEDEPAEREEMAAAIKAEEAKGKKKPGAKDEPPPFKGRPRPGGAMDGMVTKTAMDAALRKVAEDTRTAVLRTQREISDALRTVRPWVGDITVACDSADDVYRHALRALRVPKIDQIHPSAFPHILAAQPLPGTRARETRPGAADAASHSSFAERFPDAARVRVA